MLVKFLSAASVVALLASPAMAAGKKGKGHKCKTEEKWDAKAKKCVANADAAAKEAAPAGEPAPAEAPVGE